MNNRKCSVAYRDALDGYRAFSARQDPMANVRVRPLTARQRAARQKRIEAKRGSGVSQREWQDHVTGTRRGTSL